MGRIVSDETRAKISAANKGRERSAETRAKLSAAAKRNKGRPVSEATRTKLSAALTRTILGGSKRCSKCKRHKRLEFFHRDKSGSGGRVAQCIECVGKRRRKFKNSEDRFWKRYNAVAVRVGECIELPGWSGARDTPMVGWRKQRMTVARLVYKLAIGEVPDDMFVLKSCNNKKCVRHSHLYLGTKADHLAQRANASPKGDLNGASLHPETRPRGERSRSAKLKESDIPVVYELRKLGMTYREIGKKLNVGHATVLAVFQGRTWTHVPRPTS